MGRATRAPFGLEPGEGRTAGLMALHSFAMGLSTVLFETAASALFVSRFGARALPWVYIAAAFVSTGAGALFASARRRLAFRTLMAAVLAFLLAGVVGLRAGLALAESGGLVFSLLVFYRLLSVLTDLEYWAVASELYDLRQAKRLFGVIGTGEVVARIAGAFAVPLLVSTLGVENLLWLSAGALALCLAVLLRILPAEATRAARSPGTTGSSRFGGLLAQPYLRQIFALALCGVLAKHFVDFAFLAATRERAADVKAFASFFGLFSGFTQGLSLLTRLLVSGPVLTRFGIRTGLLVLPAVQLAVTLALLGASLRPEASLLVFALVVANQGFYKILKHPIDNPCFKVLYQPLPRQDRLAVQAAVETIVTPVTTGLAGLVMLLFATRFDPVAFAWALLATFVAWLAVASGAGRAYTQALLSALRSRLVRGEGLELGDEASRRALEATLRSERPGDVLFALHLLERTAPERAAQALAGLAAHQAPEVRSAALQRLESRRDRFAAALVADRLRLESSPAVKQAAISALVTLQGEDAAPLVSSLLADPDEGVRTTALGALLRADRHPHSPWRAELLRRAGSEVASDRLDAARALLQAPPRAFDDALLGLLADPDPSVRRHALAAAGRAGGEAVWPLVTRALADPRVSGAAAAALVAGGPAALPALEQAFEAGADDPQAQTRLVRAAASLGATSILRRGLAARDGLVRLAALRALAAMGQRLGEEDRPRVVEALRAEARFSAAVLAAAGDLACGEAPATGACVLLQGFLRAEADRAGERALLWLALGHDSKVLARVREAMGQQAREKRAVALELLDVTLEGEERDLALALCAEAGPRERALDALFPQESQSAAERLRALVADRDLRAVLRGAALYTIAERGLGELRAAVEAAGRERGREALVDETAAFAESVLAGAGALDWKGRRMLTIEKVLTLKAARMFQEASEDVLAEVAALLEEVEAGPGEVVFAKGDTGDSMYIVADGRMSVSDGERTVHELGEGEVFGELALLDPEPRLFTVAAREESRLLRLDREAFLELMGGNIEIVRGVLHVLCERLRQAEASAAAERS